MRAAGLHGDRAGDTSDYGSEELEDFGDSAPVYFNHKDSFIVFYGCALMGPSGMRRLRS